MRSAVFHDCVNSGVSTREICTVLKRFAVTVSLALLTTAGHAETEQSKTPAPVNNPSGQMVLWPAPAVASPVKLSEHEAEAGRQNGRKTPTPEFLQPTLDPSLPSYQPRKGAKLTGTFKGAASDVLPGLVNLWIDKFKKYHPNVKISIAPPYAGSIGAQELVKENLQFVFVSRELKPDDIVGFNAKFAYPPLSVPISGAAYRHYGFLDAVGFFVHKDNPLEKITYDQIDAIYSSTNHRGGKPITTWGELGLTGEWADKPIHAYGIKPWNGFEEFIRQKVLSRDDKRGEWRDGVKFEKVVFPMARHAQEDRYGLAYSGLAYIDAGVKMLPIADNANGPFYAPTYENVALATYPLSRLIYFNTNKAPGKPLNPALEEFLRFILSKEGQQVVLDQAIYLPLRGQQVDSARALLGN